MIQDSNSVGASRHEIKINEQDAARFWAKVNKDGPTMPHMKTPCWVWTAKKGRQGYGRFNLLGKMRFAHRISFILNGGVFTAEKPCCLHRCDNTSCVNPNHLFPGSIRDNQDDMMAKGRGIQPRGESNGSCKLTDAQCDYIRSSNLQGVALARELGVHPSQISRIRRGEYRQPVLLHQPNHNKPS